jgi:hypothetical protein
MHTIIARLREPSTMAGLGILLALFGLPAGVPELIGQVIAGAAGLAAVFMPESARP